MSSEEAEAIEDYYSDSDTKQVRRDFIRRMEHKLRRKERYGRW